MTGLAARGATSARAPAWRGPPDARAGFSGAAPRTADANGGPKVPVRAVSPVYLTTVTETTSRISFELPALFVLSQTTETFSPTFRPGSVKAPGSV